MSGEARRSLGFWRCWSLVVGGTIGSAIFMMPAVMAPYGGIGLLSLAVATLDHRSFRVRDRLLGFPVINGGAAGLRAGDPGQTIIYMYPAACRENNLA